MVLVLAMAMAPLVVHCAVAAFAPLLVEDLGLTRTQVGGFTSVMFVTPALSAPLMGRLVDRWGPRGLTLMIFLVVGAATVALVTSMSYAWLLVAAVLAGIPMATANPATNQVIRSTIPFGERGLMMGVKQSGVQVGKVLAGALLPLLAVAVGWRASAATVLLLGLVGLVMAAVLVPSVPPPVPAEAASPEAGRAFSLVRILAVYGFFMGRASRPSAPTCRCTRSKRSARASPQPALPRA